MPKFDKEVFKDHISEFDPDNMSNLDALADDLWNYSYNNKTSWTKYQEDLKQIITDHGFTIKNPDRGYPFAVPEIDKVDTTDQQNILKYLDFTKGLHIEDEICRYLIESPTLVYKFKEIQTNNETVERSVDIKYDYLKQLFEVYKCNAGRPAKKFAFNLIYAVYLITGKISVFMMYTIINAYGKEVTGGFSEALNPVFSKTDLSDNAAIDTLMQVIHILRIPGNQSGYSEKNRAIAEYLIKNCFSRNFYDPRSFIQMIYYYATVNNIPYDDMSDLFKDATLGVMDKILEGIIEKKDRRTLFYSRSIRQDEWLDMSNYRILNSGVLKELCKVSELDVEKLLDRMAANVRRIQDKEVTKNCDTYEIFCKQIISKMSYNPKEFINYIINSRKFYEGFFEAHISYSRNREMTSVPYDDLESMAYDIVYNNVLHQDKIFQNHIKYGIYKFTSNEFINMSPEERQDYLYEELKNCFEFLRDYNSERDDTIVWDNIHKVSDYPLIAEQSGDEDEFIKQLINRILSYADTMLTRKQTHRADKSDRCDVIYDVFSRCCEGGKALCSAAEFSYEIDEIAANLSFDGFYSFRFHDAFLYLCMKTSNPMQTFEEINSKEGYYYWDS